MNYSYSLGGTSAKGTGSTLGKRACQWAEVGHQVGCQQAAGLQPLGSDARSNPRRHVPRPQRPRALGQGSVVQGALALLRA